MYRICNQCGLPGFARVLRCPACTADLSALPVVDGDNLTGAVIENRYQLVSFLGEGGMAWVYRGTHADLGASVAIKLLKPEIAENPGLLVRFKKEATAISALSHPNILSVISSGETASGIHFMVTEFIQGTTLSQVIRTAGKLPLDRCVDIMRQVLSGLEEAHGRGIVHRDLKPENIMVIPLRSGDDFCKIVDFGIALRRLPDEDRLTKQGEIMGTPEFMAPEVIRGEEACAASDLYAAGIILYEMLTGVLPMSGAALMDILMAHLHQEPVPVRVREPGLPQEVENLLTLAMIKDPARRISSASEFLRMLRFGSRPTAAVCRTCGQAVQSDQRFCPGCGRLQEEGDSERTTVKPQPAPTQSVEVSRRMFSVPFFERKKELAFISAFLGGKPLALEISGVAGVGKTTLVGHALAKFAGDRQVVRTTPDREGLRRAWWPVNRMISRLSGLSRTPKPKELVDLCRRLRLDPEEDGHVLTLFGFPPQPCPLEFRVRRREMIVTAARLMLLAAQEKQAWLVFLDVDEFDALSRQVMEHVIALNLDEGIRVIMTTKRPVMAESGPAARLVKRLNLAPFDEPTAARFCTETLAANGLGPDPAQQRLVLGAGGLPLHLVEGMRLLHEGIADLERPLSDLVQMRIRNLPGATRRLLQWIALAGGRLSERFVRESGFLEKASVDAILDCVRHGFLRPDTEGQLELAHASFQRIILAEMHAVLRIQMHQAFFEHLESVAADPRSLAAAAQNANALEQAIGLMERAGVLCLDTLDDPGALYHFRKAYELAELGARSGTGLPRFVSIGRRHGDLLRHTGRPVDAERVLREVMLYCKDQDPDTPVVLSALARCTLETAPEHAEGLSRRAMKMALRSDDPQILFRVFHDFGQIAIHRGSYGDGMDQLRLGIAHLEKNAPAFAQTWRLLLQSAVCARKLGRVEAAVGSCRRILELPGIDDSWLAQARCHEELVKLALVAGDAQEAIVHLSRVIAYHRFTGDRNCRIDSQLQLAELDPENRNAWAQDALALAQRIGSTGGQQRASRLLGLFIAG